MATRARRRSSRARRGSSRCSPTAAAPWGIARAWSSPTASSSPAMALAVHRPRPAIVRGSVQQALAPLPLSSLPAPPELLWSLKAMGLLRLGGWRRCRPGGGGALRLAGGALAAARPRGRPAAARALLAGAAAIDGDSPSSGRPIHRAGALRAQDGARPAHRAAFLGRGLALTRLEVQLSLEAGGEARFALPLSRPTCSTRLLLQLVRERLGEVQLGAPVTRVGVEALQTGAAERVQLCVGSRPQVDEALETALSRLRSCLERRRSSRRDPPTGTGPSAPGSRAPSAPGDARAAPPPSRARRGKRAFLARLLAEGGEPPALGRVPLPEDPLLVPGARPGTRLLRQPLPLDVSCRRAGASWRCASGASATPRRAVGARAAVRRVVASGLRARLLARARRRRGRLLEFRDERDGRSSCTATSTDAGQPAFSSRSARWRTRRLSADRCLPTSL